MPPKPPARPRDGRVFSTLGTFGLAAGFAVPAVLLGGAQADAAPVAPTAVVAGDRQPVCGEPDAERFPIETRIHGGPDSYASGGGYGIWYLDLTNTTPEPCRAIHPVLVLTDEDRTLTPSQVQLEFSEESDPDARHRVTWESTERHEQIGVFGGGDDDDFPGFTVPAGGTLTVEVRMAFTSDTEPGRITANAAVVQRLAAAEAREDDGDWVGESEDYTFAVVEGGPDGGTDVEQTGPAGEADGGSGTGTDRSELARTGRGDQAAAAGIASGVLLAGGVAALAGARRIRRVRH
uniref:Peptidase n=1 Tax=Streptomyces sp. NBC_01401 TaxID=2903854 RepID=A0AAU3H0V9_9ACTN